MIHDLDSRERMGLATWSGSAWLNAAQYDDVSAGIANTDAGDLPAGVGWLGSSGVAVCVYADNSGTLDWARWTAAGGWVVQPDVAVAGKAYTDSVQVLYDASSSQVLVLLSDSAGALFSARYDGTSWSVSTALESTLSANPALPFGAALAR